MHKLMVLYPEPADPDHFRDYATGGALVIHYSAQNGTC